MNMKKSLISMLVLLMTAVSGAWAQDDEVELTPVSDGSWTLVMPSADVELEVEYYTDAELLEMGETVELTKTADGVWTLAAMPECDIELIVEYEPPTAYETWAAANGITGAWNEKSGGIYNVFRYVFGQPTGDFPLITGIDVGESEVVITTTPLAVANGDGVTVSVVESSDLAGETVTDTQALEEDETEGRAEFTKSAETPRFYRLKADVTIAAPAATVTTAQTAKTGVKAGQNEAIVNAGTATGGTMMYQVTTTNTKPTSTDGFSATVPTAEGLTAGTYYVWYYVKADDSHTDSEIAGPVSVTVTPATITVTINQSDWGGWDTPFTKDGVTVSAVGIDLDYYNLLGPGTFSTTLGNFTKIVVTAEYCGSNTGWNDGTWTGTPASTVYFDDMFAGVTTIVCTIVPTN